MIAFSVVHTPSPPYQPTHPPSSSSTPSGSEKAALDTASRATDFMISYTSTTMPAGSRSYRSASRLCGAARAVRVRNLGVNLDRLVGANLCAAFSRLTWQSR